MEAHEFKELYSKKISYENVEVPDGEMSPLERFYNIFEFKKVDRIIDAEFGYWKDTLKRWHKEGLPEYVNDNDKAELYFGMDTWCKYIPANTTLEPVFERQILSNDGSHQIIINEEGIRCEVFTDGTDSIPHYLEFPIKDRATYLPFKDKLLPKISERITCDLRKVAEDTKNRNYVLGAPGGSTAGYIRNWMGFETICMALYDQPELLDEILEDLNNMLSAIAEEISKHTMVDIVGWWEDIAFKNGPIVTPSWFIEKCGAVIRHVMDIYRGKGNKFAIVDCDGDFRTLMPGWLDNGINIMFPLEVASGIHPTELRRSNPEQRMMGGVDKVVLLKGKDAIKKELLELKKIADEGGFIPHVDHRVQPDVSYENYLYYLEVKRDIFEIPNRVQE